MFLPGVMQDLQSRMPAPQIIIGQVLFDLLGQRIQVILDQIREPSLNIREPGHVNQHGPVSEWLLSHIANCT